MTDPTPADPGAQARAFRVLAFALVSAPVYMLVAVWFAAPESEEDLPTLVAAAFIGLTVLGWLAAELLGYRVAPLTSGEGTTVAVQRFQQSMLLRFVLTEAPVILGIASAFVLPYGPWPAVVAVVVGLPALAFHVVPTGRAISKVTTRLESGGVPSGLREAFGQR